MESANSDIADQIEAEFSPEHRAVLAKMEADIAAMLEVECSKPNRRSGQKRRYREGR